MPAANTDKFKKGARKWVGQIGSGGVSDDTVTTIPLSSATNLPTDTAVVAVIDRVSSTGAKTAALEESVIGVVSGSNLVNCIRGAEGTAQAHLAGAVVEILITNKGWNDLIDGLLVEHNQDGTHLDASTTVQGVVELATTAETETGTDATRAVTPDGLHDMTTLAGAAWFLDEDDMASDSAVKTASQQSIKAYVDSIGGTGGWSASADTWVYASASSFTISGVDRTAVYQKGTFLRFKQGGAYKYAVVRSSSFSTNTTVNIIVNTDHTIANSSITDNAYSYQANPEGFPAWFTFSPTVTWNSTPPSGTTTTSAQYAVVGKTCFIYVKQNNTVAGTTNTQVSFDGPIAANITANEYAIPGNGLVSTAEIGTIPTAQGRAVGYGTTPTIYLFFTSMSAKSFQVAMQYPI